MQYWLACQRMNGLATRTCLEVVNRELAPRLSDRVLGRQMQVNVPQHEVGSGARGAER
jgi:hypothetical protein